MKYTDIKEALEKANLPEAVAVLEQLKEEDRRRRSPRRPPVSQPMTPELAEQCRVLRRTTKLTNSQIANRLNVNQGRVSEAIHGIH